MKFSLGPVFLILGLLIIWDFVGNFSPSLRAEEYECHGKADAACEQGIVDDELPDQSQDEIPLDSFAGKSFQVCNKSEETIWVALGYKQQNTWYADGWWKVRRGKCSLLKENLSGVVYSYATTDTSGDGSYWTPGNSSTSFCINSQDNFKNSDTYCQSKKNSEYRWENFGAIVRLRDGNKTFTWDLHN